MLTRERKLALVRYQFLAETDYYLSDATRPALPHGVVWRYMVLMVTNLWLRKDITTVGLDRDLVDVALRSVELGRAPDPPWVFGAVGVGVAVG